VIRKFLERFAARRKPDFIIGDSYLLRWWIIPRNRWFNIYLHQIRHSDDDRALHDHPWWNVSIILSGQYDEITPRGKFSRRTGSIIFRRATASHRLIVPVVNGGITYVWTLFITGPVIRQWGFHCPKGWVHWKLFTNPDDKGQVGRGCDQP
jgi:hypothetical protein